MDISVDEVFVKLEILLTDGAYLTGMFNEDKSYGVR